MWTSIISLISPYTTKYLTPVLTGVCLTLMLVCYYLYQSNKDLAQELTTAKTNLAVVVQLHESERLLAKTTIDNQNKDIEKYKIDVTNYLKTIKEKEKVSTEISLRKQKQLSKELAKDSSSDNQLEIIKRMMREFSNGE